MNWTQYQYTGSRYLLQEQIPAAHPMTKARGLRGSFGHSPLLKIAPIQNSKNVLNYGHLTLHGL